jgi:hypothetical protein
MKLDGCSRKGWQLVPTPLEKTVCGKALIESTYARELKHSLHKSVSASSIAHCCYDTAKKPFAQSRMRYAKLILAVSSSY